MTDQQKKAVFLSIVAAIRDTLPADLRTLEAVAWFTRAHAKFDSACQAWAERWRVGTREEAGR
jgi:hypothetical protein